jgi:hypothetical protein
MSDQPTFGPFTIHVDSAGQEPTITIDVAKDGRAAQLGMDKLVLELPAGDVRSGVVVLSGSLAVTVPERLNLVGFLLSVDGQVSRTPGTQTLVSAAIGGSSQVLEGPLLSISGVPENAEETDDFLTTTDFALTCHTLDFNPVNLGVAPHQPLPPIPITVVLQGRCRLPEETVNMSITTVTVSVLSF